MIWQAMSDAERGAGGVRYPVLQTLGAQMHEVYT
jgi:hypothetical protein